MVLGRQGDNCYALSVKDRSDMLTQGTHPLAGASMTGAEMLVQVLADEGVDTVFGYSGGAILPIYDAVFRYNQEHGSTMPLIVPANEQGAGFMAAGYARASGRVGVALVTSGPGATNTVTPVRDCQADSVPIVVICGQVATTAIGTDAFQEAPVPSIMGAVAKHVFLVTDPARLEATVRTAFELARTGRPGPVVLDIPKDVQNWKGTFHGSGRLPIPGYRQRMNRLEANRLPDAACAAFFAALAQAERPLIYAGGGVINAGASQVLREFARGVSDPRRDHAHGHRGRRYDASLVHAHAGHARRRVRELRGGGLRLPVRRRCPLRRSGGRQSARNSPAAPGSSPIWTSTLRRSTRSSGSIGATWD